MIQLIRPIPKHLDAWHVQRLAAMSPELVRAHLDDYKWERQDRLQREDRDRFDAYIEAAQFVLSESEPFETRIARQRAEMDRLQFFLDQHRAIVTAHEAEMAEHRMAMDELCLLAQQAEVAA
jgi:hypothetical protein